MTEATTDRTIAEQAHTERAKAITQRFLEGTTANTPEEAVNTGQRTLEQWCNALRQPSTPAAEQPFEYTKKIDGRKTRHKLEHKPP